MTEVAVIIFVLIACRVFALAIIARVLHQQLQYIGLHDAAEYNETRRIMIGLSISIIFANLVPLTLDVILLFVPSLFTMTGLVAVMSSNVLGDVLQALLIRRLYAHSEIDTPEK